MPPQDTPEWSVEFYSDRRGRSPAREFLRKLGAALGKRLEISFVPIEGPAAVEQASESARAAQLEAVH